MITVTKKFEINLTPREIEHEIWELDENEQTDLLLALAQRMSNDPYHVHMQLASISDAVKKLLSSQEKTKVVELLDTIKEYITN